MLGSVSCPDILLCYLSLLLSYSFSTTTITSTTIKSNETDRVALLAIKSQIDDPSGVTSSWNSSVSLCLWRGVTCGRRHRRVTGLDLANLNIGGSLSAYIGNLSFLRYIDLSGNNFYGKIPQEVGRLFRLQSLLLSNNSFSGTIPNNLSHCSDLIQFFANLNNLVGEIPTEIGYLLKLELLDIGTNHIIGELPASIGNLSALQVLAIKENSLNGRIPDTLGQLRNLNFLNVAQNKFSGMVPPSIFNISSLDTFSLLSNRFNGSLPLNIGFTLPNLERFSIRENGFTGPLPGSFSNASKLERFDVSENHFSGEVSIDFSELKNLSKLSMGVNNLGTAAANDLQFINSLMNSSELKNLGLYKNQFGGMLPRSIANLSTTMILIALGSNQISGTIPPGIANLVKLNAIGLEFNKLSGTIPQVIGQLKNLELLYLQGNNLQGTIPTSLGNLTLLNQLALESNNLGGNIPSSLANCQRLVLFNVSQNKLTGILPRQILGITTLSFSLDLSDNLLDGPFPLEVGNLKNLVALDISRNKFSGEIPVTLGGCTSLEYFYMQGNSFSGSIPSSLSSLNSIRKLDLSCNSLSGRIPQYLANLSSLEFLNLSFNHFEGEIPTGGVFSNSKNISITGNEKLCGGLQELHLPSCHSNGPKNPTFNRLKVVLPLVLACLILSACFIVVLIRRRKASRKSLSMLQMDEQFQLVSYAELNKATNEFSSSNMIGQGSYGFVYKGVLEKSGLLVAVKVFNLKQKGASKSFLAECKALRNIRHRNLVKIVTICSSIDFKGNDFKALVYEYMQNGSLEDCLHQKNDQLHMRNLSLIERLNIVIDVASAIEYLHHHCQPAIIHGDLKPSNVLLDHDMVAHVGDFGLARILSDPPTCADPESQTSSIGIRGTVGYVAPEYGMGAGVSMPGDVHSFGILLLELFTGIRPTDSKFNNGLTLHRFVRMALPEEVMDIVETSLLLEETAGNRNVAEVAVGEERRIRIGDCLTSVMTVGVQCSMESPAERMEMTDVVAKLCAARKNLLGRRL